MVCNRRGVHATTAPSKTTIKLRSAGSFVFKLLSPRSRSQSDSSCSSYRSVLKLKAVVRPRAVARPSSLNLFFSSCFICHTFVKFYLALTFFSLEKFGSSRLGKATAIARAALPCPPMTQYVSIGHDVMETRDNFGRGRRVSTELNCRGS